ncbi:hypothetical protein C9I49_27605 [Pseudomonas prosekii]|uniref:Uncharacterized protein n=1 Tax=Pseudomonas prosekii TaxID=1148509 RepID=A0A2U2D060_9PSED|nr:hypothetical protein C9I49_27605 [Pseudomonas prosekii]
MSTKSRSNANPLWELSLLANAVGQLASVLADTSLSRASSLPQGDWMCLQNPGPTQNRCGRGAGQIPARARSMAK